MRFIRCRLTVRETHRQVNREALHAPSPWRFAQDRVSHRPDGHAGSYQDRRRPDSGGRDCLCADVLRDDADRRPECDSWRTGGCVRDETAFRSCATVGDRADGDGFLVCRADNAAATRCHGNHLLRTTDHRDLCGDFPWRNRAHLPLGRCGCRVLSVSSSSCHRISVSEMWATRRHATVQSSLSLRRSAWPAL